MSRSQLNIKTSDITTKYWGNYCKQTYYLDITPKCYYLDFQQLLYE